jgi:hypothetical protein
VATASRTRARRDLDRIARRRGATGALTSTACATHACDGSFVNDERQDPPNSGHYVVGKMVDEDTWESNGLDEPWFDFPGQRTYWFNTPQLLGREPLEMLAYITTVDNPNAAAVGGAAPDNYTLASGNVAEFLDYRGDHFQVKNDTCGHYFVRVVVRVAPVNDAGAPPSTPRPMRSRMVHANSARVTAQRQ